LLRHEAEQCQAQLQQLQADLVEFEQRYHLSSSEFYRQFPDSIGLSGKMLTH